MKRLFFTFSTVLLSVSGIFAQESKSSRTASSCPTFYLGVSTGLENPAGLLGFNIELPIQDFSLGGGAGLSTWGFKVFGEGRYYFEPCNRGFALGLGVSHNTGLANVTLRNQQTNIGRRDIVLDLHPTTNLFFSGYKFFNMGRSGRNRFHLQAGYSARLTSDIYTMKSPFYFDAAGERAMKMAAPGGVILALGFSFGL